MGMVSQGTHGSRSNIQDPTKRRETIYEPLIACGAHSGAIDAELLSRTGDVLGASGAEPCEIPKLSKWTGEMRDEKGKNGIALANACFGNTDSPSQGIIITMPCIWRTPKLGFERLPDQTKNKLSKRWRNRGRNTKEETQCGRESETRPAERPKLCVL